MRHLIGYSGLIGSTIQQFETFDYFFNSKNFKYFKKISNDGDSLFLTCLPATKWQVNKNLKEDLKNINNIIDILSEKEYEEVILISTIDIYNDSPSGVNEDYSPNISKLSYGNNRYLFELLVKEFIKTKSLKIFRLPALFNNLIKKNILFDLLNNNNVEQINLNSYFQWYNLDNLSNDINYYKESYPNENIFNLFTEPIYTNSIIELFPQHKDKVKSDNLIKYDYK